MDKVGQLESARELNKVEVQDDKNASQFDALNQSVSELTISNEAMAAQLAAKDREIEALARQASTESSGATSSTPAVGQRAAHVTHTTTGLGFWLVGYGGGVFINGVSPHCQLQAGQSLNHGDQVLAINGRAVAAGEFELSDVLTVMESSTPGSVMDLVISYTAEGHARQYMMANQSSASLAALTLKYVRTLPMRAMRWFATDRTQVWRLPVIVR